MVSAVCHACPCPSRYLQCSARKFCNGKRQAFLEHYKHTNERVPPEPLLNVDISD